MKYYVIGFFLMMILSGYFANILKQKLDEVLLAIGCCGYRHMGFFYPILEQRKDDLNLYHKLWLVVNGLSIIGTIVACFIELTEICYI